MRDYEPLYTPLVGLASAWLPKAATAALLTWAIEIARAVGATYSALLATDAALVALIGLLIALDITDSQKAEAALRERNAALEEADAVKARFLATMSYELRTPLTSIGGFAELLKEGVGGELSEAGREYVAAILSSAILLAIW
jgi:signal transduction histidine kinase